MDIEIIKPNNTTYWIITDGTNYGDGATESNQVTSIGHGWTIYWQGNDYDTYCSMCQDVGIIPTHLN